MVFWQRIFEKLKRPSAGLFALSCVLTLLLASGSLLMLLIDYEATAIAVLVYALFGLSAVSLGYTVYGLILYVPRWKGWITERLLSRPLTSKLLKNYGFRTLLFSIGSLALTVLYGVYNGVIAVVFRSPSSVWYGALATYYIFLACMRGGILLYHGKHRGKERQLDTDLRKYRTSGVLLMITIMALSAAILQMVKLGAGFEKPGLMIYVAATYTFYKITMAIINMVKAKHYRDFSIQAIRNVNLADATVSVLALQTAMFAAFSEGADTGFANALTGAAVCAVVFTLGLYMVIRATTLLKKRKIRNGERENERKI
ncbi:MAG: hypothetical protein IKD47_03225 [Clostridia bacterium]|nr:hypothetical protein [Clostridia bacterium]